MLRKMKSLLHVLTILSLLGSGVARAGSVYVEAISTNGGKAGCTGESYGDSRVKVQAFAHNGGTSMARGLGFAGPGGCSDVDVLAIGDGGRALSEAKALAYEQARVVASSVGVTNGGQARSASYGRGRGHADVASHSRAESGRFGFADSESRAIGDGRFGGFSRSYCDSVARSHRMSRAFARGVSRSQALGGGAYSHSVTRSLANHGRETRANAHVTSLSRGGFSRAYGSSFDY